MDSRKTIGPVKIFGKTYAAGNASDITIANLQLDPPSGYAELFQCEEDSIKYLLSKELIDNYVEAYFGPLDRHLVAEDCNVSAIAKPQNIDERAIAMGMLTSDITDVGAGADPAYSHHDIGGDQDLNWWTLFIKQQVVASPARYRCIFLMRATIVVNGDEPWSRKSSSIVPVDIKPTVMDSGTFDGKFGRMMVSDGSVTVSASSVLPASQSVGDVVVIDGSGFGRTQGSGSVVFNAAKTVLTVYSWSDTQIVCLIPADATTGAITVTRADGVSGDSASYTIV
jgi:hypothetical protein